jgi:uncharacterized protein YcfJ
MILRNRFRDAISEMEPNSPPRIVWADQFEDIIMKTLIICVAALGVAFSSAAAEAKGCIKGALVGGVAGHFAGHHGTVGAVAGCVIGRHEANKADAERAAQKRSSQPHDNQM